MDNKTTTRLIYLASETIVDFCHRNPIEWYKEQAWMAHRGGPGDLHPINITRSWHHQDPSYDFTQLRVQRWLRLMGWTQTYQLGTKALRIDPDEIRELYRLREQAKEATRVNGS